MVPEAILCILRMLGALGYRNSLAYSLLEKLWWGTWNLSSVLDFADCSPINEK